MNERFDSVKAKPSINTVIESDGNWQYEAILNQSPNEYQAFICSPRGSHCIGTFNTKDDAEAAIKEAHQARWNG